MTIVFRVEDVNGEGPYQYQYDNGWNDPDAAPAFIRDLRDSERMHPDPHPTPASDGLSLPIAYGEHFGFHTMTQLAAWMLREPEDADKLALAGYQVSVYKVRVADMRHGRRQIVFWKSRAVKIRSYTMHDLAAMLPIPSELPA